MTGKDKRVCIMIAIVLFLVAVWVFIMPTKVEATDGSSSTTSETQALEELRQKKKVYESSSSKSSNSTSETKKEVADVGKEIENTTEMAKDYIDDVMNTAHDILDSSEYKKLSSEYKTPDWLKKITRFFSLSAVSAADWAARLYSSLASLLIINSIFALLSDKYYDFLNEKKFRGIMKSVDITRQKYQLSSGQKSNATTSTTTSTKDGTITNTVTNVAKTITGPGAMIVYMILNSIIEIGVIISIFILIKLGFIQDAINAFVAVLGKGIIALFSLKG